MEKKNFFVGGMATTFMVMLITAIFFISGCTSPAPAPATNSGSASSAASEPAQPTNITVVSREEGSGTRGAFVELLEVLDSNKKDATTTSAIVTNSTSVALTTVAGDAAAIGYISLGSLNDTVKALEIDGVKATTDNVKNGTYPIQRPFNIATKGEGSAAAKDFMNYIMSKEGQAIIEKSGFISGSKDAAAYKADASAEGKVVIAGSSSVSPVMEKLIEAYKAANSKVSVDLQTSDSSTGMKQTIEGVADIGMASRDLKDSEKAELTGKTIAIDGIAVIANNDNKVKGLTSEQVRDIFLGELTSWGDIK